MRDGGISLLVVDTPENLSLLRDKLGVGEPMHIDNLISNVSQVEDLVFYTPFHDGRTLAEQYITSFNIRRAVIAIGDKVTVHGRDLGWMKAVVAAKATPAPNQCVRHGIAIPEERDDPWQDLGYTR